MGEPSVSKDAGLKTQGTGHRQGRARHIHYNSTPGQLGAASLASAAEESRRGGMVRGRAASWAGGGKEK